MGFSSDQLTAFLSVWREGSFTHASKKLGLTQPALSQKIARLEEMLQSPLFVRMSLGLSLTSAGEELLSFAQAQLQHEQDFLARFNQYTQDIRGVFRLGGYSSINRSVIIPTLAPWIRQHPGVSIEFSVHEVVDLIQLLKSGKLDAVLIDQTSEIPGIEHAEIGKEEFVEIEAKNYKNIKDCYLDHGPHDNATESFFKFQRHSLHYQRGYMGDVYSILDGVAAGLGRAIMSRHLVDNDDRFKIIKHRKKYFRAVSFCYIRKAYYSPVHLVIKNILEMDAKKFL
jgi:DNA-binding transcriptional LysR family regulator